MVTLSIFPSIPKEVYGLELESHEVMGEASGFVGST